MNIIYIRFARQKITILHTHIYFFRCADVLTCEIKQINVARTIYFILFQVRCADGTICSEKCQQQVSVNPQV